MYLFQISKYDTGSLGGLGGGRQHRRLPRVANTLAPPLLAYTNVITHVQLSHRHHDGIF